MVGKRIRTSPILLDFQGVPGFVLIITYGHTFATRSLEQGMDVVTLSRLLGHANPSITLDKYGHALDDHKKASIGKLGELYSGTRKMPPANTRSGAAGRGWER